MLPWVNIDTVENDDLYTRTRRGRSKASLFIPKRGDEVRKSRKACMYGALRRWPMYRVDRFFSSLSD